VENCISALRDIESGKIHKCFIEMSACVGSCIGGPVMEKFHRSPVKDYITVSNYAGNKDFLVDAFDSEELSKDFYNVFDDAFLNIYPTFITSVNSLLMPDKQITLLPDEKMNTDLRILALMRLGIEDSSRIAQMLNYSVNTIYTYRNKLKNKAIDRDKFEENIMEIPSIS
jgi:hypothetical protein